ncbi:MAG: hypothetical protein MZV64_22965 [Ignavibacteriales bacterium]|nr:hypothetical protein [Ignavibacteriales bacterium]
METLRHPENDRGPGRRLRRSERGSSPAVAAEAFVVHRASGLRPALTSPFGPEYPGGEGTALTDGLLGTKDRGRRPLAGIRGRRSRGRHRPGPGPARFAAWRCGALQNINSWIFLPTIGRVRGLRGRKGIRNGGHGRERRFAARTPRWSSRNSPPGSTAAGPEFVRVLAQSLGAVPDWHYGAGGKAWLFADEIVVE